MLNICMRGFAKAVGLALLSFCLGVIAGALLPPIVVAVIELLMLIGFGCLCLFKW